MTERTFVPILTVATRLGVPATWLREQAKAGQIPFLRAGRRILMNPEAVESALLERAAKGEGEAAR